LSSLSFSSLSSDGIDPRRTIVAARQNTRNVDILIQTRVYVRMGYGRDIVYLKCGRRSRLLPIHLAQDGRQIELPLETQDQRALAAFLSFLPSFLHRASRLLFPSLSLPISYSISFLYFSSLFFYSLRLLASFFTRLVSNHFFAIEDTWLLDCLQNGKEAKGMRGERKKEREREREREKIL